MQTRHWIMFALLLRAGPALAVQDGLITIEPAAVDTYVVRFHGRSLSTATVTCTTVKGTDGSPANIVSGQVSASGTDVTFRLAPGAGRKGNSYHCVVQPTDSDSNQPVANIRVDVKQTVIVP